MVLGSFEREFHYSSFFFNFLLDILVKEVLGLEKKKQRNKETNKENNLWNYMYIYIYI